MRAGALKKNPPLATGPSLGKKRRHSKSIPGSGMCRNSHKERETLRAARCEASGWLAPTSPRPEIRGTPAIGRRNPPGRDGVIRFQHRRKIGSLLIRNTVAPLANRTTSRSCLVIERANLPKTRSFYENHPAGRSKTVRTAVGRSISPVDEIGHASQPGAGGGEPADRRA